MAPGASASGALGLPAVGAAATVANCDSSLLGLPAAAVADAVSDVERWQRQR